VAIFGNLKHFSLGDLLVLLSSQDGALELFNLPGRKRITLYVSKGRLRSVHVNERPVDPLQARSVLGELVQAERGGFEFIPGARPHRRGGELDWPLEGLLVGLAAFNDEIGRVTEALPHPDTVFRFVRMPSFEDPHLKEFWNRAHGYLVTGASARQLSTRLGVRLDLARFYLHTLRQMGAVEPIRAAAASDSSRKAVAGRLLSALKKRFLGRG